jgi:hypothetical protein
MITELLIYQDFTVYMVKMEMAIIIQLLQVRTDQEDIMDLVVDNMTNLVGGAQMDHLDKGDLMDQMVRMEQMEQHQEVFML